MTVFQQKFFFIFEYKIDKYLHKYTIKYGSMFSSIIKTTN